MHQLNEAELYKALEFAKSVDETTGRLMIQKFQTNLPVFYEMSFNLFPGPISTKNRDMAYYYLDLCFDVLAVFEFIFGKVPDQETLAPDWLDKQSQMINSRLKPALERKKIEKKTYESLRKSFLHKFEDETHVNQSGLIDFINDQIDQFVAEESSRASATHVTKIMILIFIFSLGNIYSQSRI